MPLSDQNALNISCGEGALYKIESRKENNLTIDTIIIAGNHQEETDILLSFTIPILDISAMWHPACGMDRSLKADWNQDITSTISISAPVICLYNEAGINRMTFAVSEVSKKVAMNAGVHEEDGTLCCQIKLSLAGNLLPYELSIYRNSRPDMYYDVLNAVSLWWEKEGKMALMPVPDEAKRPVYSSWYSFHQNTIAKEIEKECEFAKECGFQTMIVDDGWQTGDNNRGYAYCGDWEVAEEKIPDMKLHVQQVHRLGMKYLLWFSVPFIGIHSKEWSNLSDKIIYLDENRGAGVLDLRYPMVRKYLLKIYLRAVKDWDVDGLKLDFIDEFYLRSNSPKSADGMDVYELEEALEIFLTQVIQELKAIKPDLMIEFRQRYIGPNMRRFCNIIRVSDCPESSISNRVGSVDIRLLSRHTAVHSDMIMWHTKEQPEDAARQIINSIFATIQLSVKLEEQSDIHLKMIRFWIEFVKKYGGVLQEGRLMPKEPQNLYPVITARKDGIAITAVYSQDRVLEAMKEDETNILINATKQTEMIVRIDETREYRIKQVDCCGETIYERTEKLAQGLHSLAVTMSGMLELKRK